MLRSRPRLPFSGAPTSPRPPPVPTASDRCLSPLLSLLFTEQQATRSYLSSDDVYLFSLFCAQPGYFETVTNDFRAVDGRCPGLVQQAFAKLLQLAKAPGGLATITKQFSLCKDVLPHEVEHLVLWVVNAFGNMAMVRTLF